MLEFKDEDAEAVMAKTLEGGSDSGQPNPVIPILSSLRSPSAPSRPREVFELLEEERARRR